MSRWRSKKYREKLGSDGISGWQIQQQESIRVAADRPSPVEGLRPTIQARRWFWDPSIVIPHDVRSANGSIVFKAGSRFNPLEKNNLKNDFIFFNGDDPEQVSLGEETKSSLERPGFIDFSQWFSE